MSSCCNRAEKEYARLVSCLPEFPIHFALNGKVYNGFPSCCFKTESEEANGNKKTLVLRYDATLKVRIETAVYPAYNAYEWVAWFENDGNENSPVISNLYAQNTFEGEHPLVHGIMGDHVNYYRPYCADIDKQALFFCNRIGRSCHETFPYFNLQHGDGGTVIALGWGGSWQAKFEKCNGKTLFRGNGPKTTCTYLKPGEKIRTALFAYVCYEGRSEDTATNAWRKWAVECNLPKANAQGDDLPPMLTTDNTSISYVKRLKEAGIHMDYNWIDAGWFAAADGNPVSKSSEMGMLENVGSWAVDNTRCRESGTFREFIDASHELGTKTLVWFEPERVTHVEDLERCFGYQRRWGLKGSWGGSLLNNLGDEECYEWTYGRIRNALDEMNADMYREDFNTEPGPCWKWGDEQEGENRTGITENKYMVNHYRLWDRIISDQGKKGMTTFIDSCASGGGRNDLEAMRRSVPLLRSDFDRCTSALRLSITPSLNKWLPYNGAVTMETLRENDVEHSTVDRYVARASYECKIHLPYDPTLRNSGLDDTFTKACTDEWRILTKYMLKDFYPLTPWRAPEEKDVWAVWEYFDPATDEGAVQAFRMEECEEDTYTVGLKGLKADGFYDIEDVDGLQSASKVSGRALMDGLTLKLNAKKTSALLFIKPAK